MPDQLLRKSTTQLFLALLLALIVLSGFVFGTHSALMHYVFTGYEKLQHQPYAIRLIICLVSLICIALCGILPASTGALIAGVWYGIVGGFIMASLATIIGALISFYLSRSLFRSIIERLFARSSRLQHFDQLLHVEGWKLVCLLRISPIMPFALTSYALGMTSISVRAYVMGTLASLPALLGYVFMGHMAGLEAISLHNHQASVLQTILLTVAFAGTGLLVWHLGTLINKINKPSSSFIIKNKKNF